MKLSYVYRLYPTVIQRAALDKTLNSCRFLYNSALEERISFYRKFNKSLSYNQQAKELNGIVELFPEFEDVYSQTRQGILKQLDSAFTNFFRRFKEKVGKAGFPRFKGKDRFRSILFPQVKPDLRGGGGVKRLSNNKLSVFGIPGEIRLTWHRKWKGQCKQARIAKNANQYYLVLSCDEVPLEPLAKTNKVLGIDLGLNSFIVGNDGLKIHHPKPYKKHKEKLTVLHQQLSTKKKGSNNRERAKQSLAREYQKVSNIRKDFLHKTALRLVKDYDKIVLEKLNVKAMMQGDSLAKNSNIADASWSKFIQMLLYKAERAGKEIIMVDPKHTSKTCSRCGHIQDMPLHERVYRCTKCNLCIDRDLNSSKVIKDKGLGTSPAIGKKIPISEAVII